MTGRYVELESVIGPEGGIEADRQVRVADSDSSVRGVIPRSRGSL